MNYKICCTSCHKQSANILNFRCSSCGKPLDLRRDFNFEPRLVQLRNYNAWRYSKFFPYVDAKDTVTLGEGWTPLVKFSDNLYFKLDYLNPSGSFKDRGSTTLVSVIHKQVKKQGGYIAEDSSGNAGASIAAYSARAQLKAKIYVPENVSGPKITQIRSYGMQVVIVAGSRSRVAQAAQHTEKGKFYVGHIYHPFFRDGIRTLAYEIAEQFNWKPPGRIYLPVSAGTLLLGVVSGFRHLANSGTISDVPKIVACQTKQVSPLYHRVRKLKYDAPKKVTSVADALVSTNPPLLDLMTKELQETHGDVEIVDEKETLNAFAELAHIGFFVEPSSAVAYAAYKKQLENKETSKADRTVIVLTGHGLKTNLQPAS